MEQVSRWSHRDLYNQSYFHNSTSTATGNEAFWYNRNNRTSDGNNETLDNTASIIVIAVLLFIVALVPVLFAALQRHVCGTKDQHAESFTASDGDTVAVEDDDKDLVDVEIGTTNDVSVHSVPLTEHGLQNDASQKQGSSTALEFPGHEQQTNFTFL